MLVAGIGVVLDRVTPAGAAYTMGGFRLAFAGQYLLWAVGLAGVWRYRLSMRRRLRVEDGVTVPPLHQAVLRRVHAGR